MKLTLCDDCVAADRCAVYEKGADRKCCFGNWYETGLCCQCCLLDSVKELCKEINENIVILEES